MELFGGSASVGLAFKGTVRGLIGRRGVVEAHDFTFSKLLAVVDKGSGSILGNKEALGSLLVEVEKNDLFVELWSSIFWSFCWNDFRRRCDAEKKEEVCAYNS